MTKKFNLSSLPIRFSWLSGTVRRGEWAAAKPRFHDRISFWKCWACSLLLVSGAGALQGAAPPIKDNHLSNAPGSPRAFAERAAILVANGTPADLATAEKLLDSVVSNQELHPDDPHYGNFPRNIGRPVEGFNVVGFVLSALVPMMIEHQERLSPALQARLVESIRLGLDNLHRTDVSVDYTNPFVMDFVVTCLGGEFLNDTIIAERGYRKLVEWMEFTDRSGATYEYNSANYTRVVIEALASLVRLTRDEPTRIRAQVLLGRVGLSAALHMHPATERWAGPHGRAYYPTVAGTRSTAGIGVPELEGFRDYIRTGTLPGWLADAVEWRDEPMQVVETTDVLEGIGTYTYHSKSFSLGVATRELNFQANFDIGYQSNLFTLHYRRPESSLPGSVFSRYIVDDEWVDDSAFKNGIPEMGLFHGVQDHERALSLYTTKGLGLGALMPRFSAKALVAWPRWGDPSDEVWVDDKLIESFPANVPPGSVVVVVSGDAMTAIRPLTITDAGRDAPIRVSLFADQTLAIEMYNYLGQSKLHWEFAYPGTFYQGAPRNGFYAEAAERSAYPSGAAFARVVASGKLTDVAEAPFTQGYNEHKPRLWRVEYSRDGRSLGVEADLMNWAQPVPRWTDKGELGQPMLESPIARQTRTGTVQVGGTTLTSGKQPAWLFVSPKRRLVVAAYHGPGPAPLTLKLPEGSVELDGIETGMVIWDNGKVSIEGIGIKGTPRVTGGRLAQ